MPRGVSRAGLHGQGTTPIVKPAQVDLLRQAELARNSGLNDWWDVNVEYAGSGENSLIGDDEEKVGIYLRNIEILWNLGTKPRSPRASISETALTPE
jgi:hypothetical protein